MQVQPARSPDPTFTAKAKTSQLTNPHILVKAHTKCLCSAGHWPRRELQKALSQ